MRSPFRAPARPVGPDGFTLVELLVVLAIIIIVAAITIPSIGPLMSSYNLSRAGAMVTDELNFCRQTALTKNADVEVRFYQVGSTTYTIGNPFTAFRAFLANASAPSQAVGLDKINYLPGQVIISSATDSLATSPSTTFSPLLESTHYSTVLSTGTDTLPGGTQAVYVSFLFRATGGTNLPTTGSLWYLTLYTKNAPIVAATSLPSNYVTVQVDPVEGQIRTYRP